jgi:hypothetical protein
VEEVAREVFCPGGFNLLQKDILHETIDSVSKIVIQWDVNGDGTYIKLIKKI